MMKVIYNLKMVYLQVFKTKLQFYLLLEVQKSTPISSPISRWVSPP
jgi:hypothetical protein